TRGEVRTRIAGIRSLVARSDPEKLGIAPASMLAILCYRLAPTPCVCCPTPRARLVLLGLGSRGRALVGKSDPLARQNVTDTVSRNANGSVGWIMLSITPFWHTAAKPRDRCCACFRRSGSKNNCIDCFQITTKRRALVATEELIEAPLQKSC